MNEHLLFLSIVTSRCLCEGCDFVSGDRREMLIETLIVATCVPFVFSLANALCVQVFVVDLYDTNRL